MGGGGAEGGGKQRGGGGQHINAISKLSYFTYCREVISTLQGFSSEYSDTKQQYDKFVALLLACLNSLNRDSPTFYKEAEALFYDILGSGDLSELKAGNRIFLHDEEDLFYLSRIGNLIAMKSIYQAGGPIASLGNRCTLGQNAVEDYITISSTVENMNFYESNDYLIKRIRNYMGIPVDPSEKLANSPITVEAVEPETAKTEAPVHFNLRQFTRQKPKTRKRLNQALKNYLAEQNAILGFYQRQKWNTLKSKRNAVRAKNPILQPPAPVEVFEQPHRLIAAHGGGRRTRKMKHTKRTKSRRH